ncbi:TonB-dependent receptor [Roseivirga misakiensis]|uniref:hypothetical protein n=1 Tax=Roseivirga misakiensis TaxID=1563681 RepID=UPI00114D20EE|nr:hypothetical protein [Roseivirga misakiensis]
MKRSLSILLLFSLVAVQGFAQGTGRLEEEAEIVIRKDRKIVLPPAIRNFEKIPQLPVSGTTTKQSYLFKKFNYSLNPLEPFFQTANYRSSKPATDFTSNYVKAGYGNFGTPYFEGYLGSPKSEDYVFNLYVRHLSSRRGPVFDENSGNGKTEASVGGKFFNGLNTISGSLNYTQQKVHFFGYNPVLDLSSDAIEQKFSRFSANVAVEKTERDQDLNYSFETDWVFFRDDLEAKENKFNFDVTADYKLSENIKVSMKALAILSKRQDEAIDVNRNFLNLQPRITYAGNGFSLAGGINFAGDNDSGNGMSVYPVVEGSFSVNTGLRVYAGYEGTVTMNTLESSIAQNPFLQAAFDLRNTEKESDIYGGVELDLSKGLRLNAGASLASLNNLQLITNAASDSSRFEILYDQGPTDRLNIFSEINYEQEGQVRSSLRFDFYNYELTSTSPNLAEAWHLPTFKTAFHNTFFPLENLSVTADVYYLGGLKALNGETGEAFDLDDILDLNLGGRYQLNQQFGVFLKLNNLFGTNYQRYLNYPSRGIQFLGGISVSF